jgi:hypothetical protein
MRNNLTTPITKKKKLSQAVHATKNQMTSFPQPVK